MIKEAIDRILSLATPPTIEADGREYSTVKLTDINKPLPGTIAVRTLSGLIDLINAKVEVTSGCLVHVVSHEAVTLMSMTLDKWSRRPIYVKAELDDTPGFPFGQWMDHQRFIIGVMANFTEKDDREYLLRIASNLTNEHVVTSVDDGITQQVGVKSGAALKSSESLRNRVKLAPYRTFREVEQPVSEFIFRVRQDRDEVPNLSIAEADGGTWKITAMETIARFMRAALKDVPVIS